MTDTTFYSAPVVMLWGELKSCRINILLVQTRNCQFVLKYLFWASHLFHQPDLNSSEAILIAYINKTLTSIIYRRKWRNHLNWQILKIKDQESDEEFGANFLYCPFIRQLFIHLSLCACSSFSLKSYDAFISDEWSDVFGFIVSVWFVF